MDLEACQIIGSFGGPSDSHRAVVGDAAFEHGIKVKDSHQPERIESIANGFNHRTVRGFNLGREKTSGNGSQRR
jgi:hypothetical protein